MSEKISVLARFSLKEVLLVVNKKFPDRLEDPSIQPTDGKTFYLVMGDLLEGRRWGKKSVYQPNFITFENADRLNESQFFLTQAARFFAALENQLRRTADELAARLSTGSALSGEVDIAVSPTW